jgi:preprotein translocase SecE subunit
VASRNRRRAKERRPRAGQDESGLATAGGAPQQTEPGVVAPPPDAEPAPDDRTEHLPEPLDQAAPDVELADAQIMLGAAGFVRERDEGNAEYDRIYADEIPEDDGDDGAAEAIAIDGGSSRGGAPPRAPAGTLGGAGGGGELAAPAVAVPERPGTLSRLTNFLRGSWRELQRVQWPDRRQVMQATGVVLGFVIVAGVYLGVADYISQKVVHFILTK